MFPTVKGPIIAKTIYTITKSNILNDYHHSNLTHLYVNQRYRSRALVAFDAPTYQNGTEEQNSDSDHPSCDAYEDRSVPLGVVDVPDEIRSVSTENLIVKKKMFI